MKEKWFKPAVINMEGYVSPPQREFLAKLNQNENPFDVPQELKDELGEKAKNLDWNRYPENGSPELRAKLGKWHDIEPGQILLGSGSNQILQSLFTAIVGKGDKVITSPPVFSLYDMLTNLLDAEIIPVLQEPGTPFPIQSFLETIKRENPQLVVLCSPNNPTGYEMPLDDLETICQQSECLVFYDEAYGEFTENVARPLLEKYDNLIISRTFSKAFSLAGLRFGYFMAARPIIQQLEKINIPYNVNLFTEMVACHLIDNREFMAKHVQYLIDERARLYTRMAAIPGIRVYPSAANFLLFGSDRDIDLFAELKNRGILVRNVSSYPLLAGHQRVSVGNRKENDLFLDKLSEIMED